MKNQLLVTAIGEDRPGIVARLTEVFVKHSGNLDESRMAILGGEFAAIMLVSIPVDRVDALNKDLDSLKKDSISVTVKSTRPFDQSRFAGHAQYEISLSGADHEGIVHKVSAFLSTQAINIQSMDTEVVHAPISGTPLFQMKAIVLVPQSIALADLQKRLKDIGNQEGVEITVSPRAASDNKLVTA